MKNPTFKDKKVIYQVPGGEAFVGIATGEPMYDRIGIQFNTHWGYCFIGYVKLLVEETNQ